MISPEKMFIGKQPIVDVDGKTFAYEILFRAGDKNGAFVNDNKFATARVLVNTLNNLGIQNLLEDCRGFINVDEKIILDDVVEMIPSDKFVLEILETTKIDDLLIERVQHLQKKGYIFAIDDMDLTDKMIEEFRNLYTLVSYVKVDVMGSDKNDIRTKLNVFKEYKNISLLAEKVESIEEYNEYRKLGFLYFQGYFFSKPQVIECKKLDPTRGAILELCSLLDRDVDIKTLEEKFMKYPELTINLLRYLNSAFFGMKKDISSIRHALNMLGRSMLKKWLILFLYAGANENRFSEPLVRMAMSRAKTMTLLVEKIIKNAKDEQKDMGFMVGMLSLLDAFLNSSLQDIISGVELNAEIKNALLNKTGILGELLMFVKAFEATDFELVEKKLNDFKITYYEWMEILKESNEWVTKNLP